MVSGRRLVDGWSVISRSGRERGLLSPLAVIARRMGSRSFWFLIDVLMLMRLV